MHKPSREPSVLIVEDDDSLREMVTIVLEREGFAVLSAPDGYEAIRVARLHQPALITLDLNMPDMDGWAVLQALRADVGTRSTPVVLCTANVLDSSRVRNAGAQGYLHKPFTLDQLLEAIFSNWHWPPPSHPHPNSAVPISMSGEAQVLHGHTERG